MEIISGLDLSIVIIGVILIILIIIAIRKNKGFNLKYKDLELNFYGAKKYSSDPIKNSIHQKMIVTIGNIKRIYNSAYVSILKKKNIQESIIFSLEDYLFHSCCLTHIMRLFFEILERELLEKDYLKNENNEKFTQYINDIYSEFYNIRIDYLNNHYKDPVYIDNKRQRERLISGVEIFKYEQKREFTTHIISELEELFNYANKSNKDGRDE